MDETVKKLLVGIPALNEEKTVGNVVGGVPRSIPGVAGVTILVVDDGSTDSTAQVASEAGARILRKHSPGGVGAAFQSALQSAIAEGADLFVNIDGDGQFDPGDIPKLLEPILDGRADFVTASRFVDPALTPDMPWIKRWGNGMMSRLVSRIAGRRFRDVSCGMRAYNRRAMLNLNLMGSFTYTQEVFLNLSFKNFRIEEVPIRVRGEREWGRSRVASNLWRYAYRTLKIILRCYRDYRPLRFFGGLALGLSIPAIALELFLLLHYLRTGAFSPHIWAGFTGAVLLGIALIGLHLGMIGDMLNRHRIYLEELLFYHRRDDPSADD